MAAKQHQVVEASAGTGKTHFLEHRLVDLLLAADARIEDILVVTFTEKATAELRGRTRELLRRVITCREHQALPEQDHWLIASEERDRLSSALSSFDRATISTIHGFCHRLLGENAFAGGRLFDQTQVSTDVAFRQALIACLRDTFAVRQPYLSFLEQWYVSQTSSPVERLVDLLRDCHRGGGRIEPSLDERSLGAAARAFAQHTTPAAIEQLDGDLAAAKVHHSTKRSIVGRLREFGLDDQCDQWPLAELVSRVDQGRDTLQKIVDKLEVVPQVRELVDAARALHACAVPLSAAVAELFLKEVRDRMRADKRRQGQFDFHDMLVLVWEMLNGPGGDSLAARIRTRYPFALVDEFQDTDPLQWKIFSSIYLDCESRGFLTIVGDPKQAIYGFRGADLNSYFEASERLEQIGAERTQLRVNYRSTPELVAAVNHVLTSGDAPFFSGKLDCRAEAAPDVDWDLLDDSGGSAAPLELMDLNLGDDRPVAAEIRRLLANHVADRIHGLLTDPSQRLQRRRNGEVRPLTARDIYVLTRSSAEAQEVAETLRERGIPCALFRQLDLFATEEAREVRDLLAAVAEPSSRSSRARAWNTRFFGLSLAEIQGLSDLPDGHPLIERLHSWKRTADEQDYESLFASILSQSGIIERELFSRDSQRSIINVEHIFEVLLEEMSHRRGDLHALLRILQGWMDGGASGSDGDRAQRMESDADAVQAMTIHKSKGLQAPVVFLFGGLSASPRGRATTISDRGEKITFVGKLEGAAQDSFQAQQAQENERLLYVAVTRASCRLVLPRLPDGLVKKGAFYWHLNHRLSDDCVGALDERCEIREVGDAATTAVDHEHLQLSGWSPSHELCAPIVPPADCARINATRFGLTTSSYTRMKSRSEAMDAAGADGNESELDDIDALDDAAVLGKVEDNLPGGREMGIFLHAVVEHADLAALRSSSDFEQWCALPAVVEHFRSLMDRHAIAAQHLQRVQRIAYDSLSGELELGGQTLPAIMNAERTNREVDFLFPVLDDAGTETGMVKGSIDLLFETGDRVYVLDWKSDRLPAYDADSLKRHYEAHYELQATLYSLALMRMLGRGGAEALEHRFGGVIYYFMRGPAAHFVPPDMAALRQAELDLGSQGLL